MTTGRIDEVGGQEGGSRIRKEGITKGNRKWNGNRKKIQI
jgi:hypothetical protein